MTNSLFLSLWQLVGGMIIPMSVKNVATLFHLVMNEWYESVGYSGYQNILNSSIRYVQLLYGTVTVQTFPRPILYRTQIIIFLVFFHFEKEMAPSFDPSCSAPYFDGFHMVVWCKVFSRRFGYFSCYG